jgi:hypothetical protein
VGLASAERSAVVHHQSGVRRVACAKQS